METRNEPACILIVDDEPDIREILQFNLEHEGYGTDSAASAEEALARLSPRHRLILLDVMMGGMSGFRMADLLRKRGDTTPIIFLTAKDTENDLLTGFSIGADDYIAKPFSIKELLARVKSVLKRTQPGSGQPDTVQAGGLLLDLRAKRASIDGTRIELTKTEFNILSLLLTHEGETFTRADILNKAWGNEGIVLERTVDVHINRLRKKLGAYSNAIANRSGYGYMFDRSCLPGQSSEQQGI